ncbi:hypothetical protein PAPYR_3780 [Paratrimastix pyriformis]|uniref:HNH domain-containing protein n=1 Tax=Paratrimastix pyriformis TaxID=342808 RepID=A0ABQ8ULI5_9EUKA|nr:hypothetical protein PAPYR_3780 [Paratrimastix pyriformis]
MASRVEEPAQNPTEETEIEGLEEDVVPVESSAEPPRRLSKYQRRKLKKQQDESEEEEEPEPEPKKDSSSEEGPEEDEDDEERAQFTADEGTCELCGSRARLTFHHTIPKLIIKRLKRRGHKPTVVGVNICRLCHSTLHRTWKHGVLAKNYVTIDDLKQAPELQEYLEWKRGQVK